MAMRDPGSFRDPSGYVFTSGDRIFRAINDQAYENFLLLRSSGAYADLRSKEWIIAAEEAGEDHAIHDGRRVLKHPRLPFISYPYEWPFSLLKRAALLHLDVHLRALDFDFTLSDASAYNVQFCGVKPVFIDTPSFVPYREGDYWTGQRQFVEQFVNPLLLRSQFGISPNAWYRGSIDGLPTSDIARLLGRFKRWFAPTLLTNITLPDLLQRRARRDIDGRPAKPQPLPKTALRFLLQRLHGWISRQQPRPVRPSDWRRYGTHNDSYAEEEEERKRDFIAQFSQSLAPACAWDMGCNTGKYSEVLLQNKTRSIVGFDFDFDALEAAVSRAAIKHLHFLPLFSDAANPSPQQGWAETERLGLRSRSGADAVIALAIVHHLAISRNIPLPAVIEWLVGLAPHGVIEFVPKSDPMIQRMLQWRRDIFTDYGKAQFEHALSGRARIVRTLELSPGGRTLYQFVRTSS
jgi:ribosomal protein L11 methylase PrmA